MAESFIVDVTEQNFESVLAKSMQMPVIVDFWADWCQPCKQMAPVLEKLVRELNGQVLLAKVNADVEQAITGQFGVRSLPTLKLVVQGRLAGELVGAQTEKALRDWLAPVLGQGAESEEEQIEAFLEQVQLAIAHGQGAQAEQALRQALQHEPDKHLLRAALVEYLLSLGELAEAQSVLAEVAEDVPALRPFRNRFALLDEVKEQPAVTLPALAERLAVSPSPEDLHLYGLRAAAAGQFEAGLDALIRLLRDYPDYRDGAAKAALLKVFDCLPKGDPLASRYRRQMFNALH